MTASVFDQAKWEQALLAEAKRDLVFVFNIAAGAFGGPRPAPTQAEVPALLQRVATSLLAEGCVVGFGNPSTTEFSVPKELQVVPERLAEGVARFYAIDPEKAKFLVFAHRAEAANNRIASQETPDN
jgi:hypothetical protein